jgi:ribonuclease P protein component
LKQTFSKKERLVSKKQIDRLFHEGHSFFTFPYKVIYIIDNQENNDLPQLLISVPKRNFKKAVDRNKIKRLTREAYRKNKTPLIEAYAERKTGLLLGLLYTSKTMLSYADIERKIILILQLLIEQDGQTAG